LTVRYRSWISKEKAYPGTRAQVPFPYEGTYLIEDIVGLTPASTFLEWGVVVQGKGRPFPYEDAYLIEDLVGLTPASTFPEWGEVEKEKAYPATRAQVPFPYEDAYLIEDLVGLTPASTFPE